MKKAFRYLFLILGIMLLTGCATVQDNIVINSEGKVLRDVKIEFEVTEDNELSTLIAHDEITKRAEAEGYQVKFDDTVEGKVTYNLIKEMDSVDPNSITIPYNSVEGEGEEAAPSDPQLLTITKEQGLFKSNFSANSQLKIPELDRYEGIDYTLSVYLPTTKLDGKTNAIDVVSSEENKNQQLIWKTNDENKVDVQFDVSSTNMLYIIWVTCFAFLLVILVLYLIVRKKEKEEQTHIHRRIPTRQYNHQRHSRRY